VARKTIDTALINYKPFKIDHRIILLNKVIKYVHGIGEVLFNNEQKLAKIRGVAQDVSEYK